MRFNPRIFRSTFATGLLVCTFVVLFALMVGSAQADFGLVSGSVSATAHNKDGSIDSQAGSHPYSYDAHFAFNTDAEGHTEGGEPRDLIVDLPPGLVGDPQAVPRCPRQLFEGEVPRCPSDTQVGVLHAITAFGLALGPIFNVAGPPGVAGQLAFNVLNFKALQNVSTLSEESYRLEVNVADLPPLGLSSATASIWGVPADEGHDPELGQEALNGNTPLPPSGDTPQAFLTIPASCDAPPKISVRADSKSAPGRFVEESGYALDAGGNPSALTGCESVPFAPAIHTALTSDMAESPSGLDFALKLPNQGLLSPGWDSRNGAQEDRSDAAPGRHGQSVGRERDSVRVLQRSTKRRQRRIGTGTGLSGILEDRDVDREDTVVGRSDRRLRVSRRAARQPFDSLLALYIVAKAPERGVLDQAGRRSSRRPEHGTADDDVRRFAAVAVLLLPVRSA